MADSLSIEVPPELSGERVDKALAQILGVSRAESRYLIDELSVFVDGRKVKPGDRVKVGSLIETPPPRPVAELEPEPVDFRVVVEEPSFAVVDKPPGVVVHPGAGRSKGTLAAGLLYRYPEIEGVGAPGRWGLVHRLDRETSGLLVVARTSPAYEFLSKEIAARRVNRFYTALADGLMDIPTGTIEAPLGRDPSHPTRRAVVATGKPATTHYEVVEHFPDSNAVLLRVALDTGRTHQIRVHLAAIDHPVIGDRTYGNRLSQVTSPRVFLHASEIGFAHPETGEEVKAVSELPPDLARVVAGLRGSP